jgi:hypothetical protein
VAEESPDDCGSQASSDSDEGGLFAQQWDQENIELELEMLKAISSFQTKPYI